MRRRAHGFVWRFPPMRRRALAISLLATLLTTSFADARQAAQTGTAVASPVSQRMLQVMLDDLAPDRNVVVGIIRTSYPPSGEARFAAGAGPTVVVVESGSVVIALDTADPTPLVVRSDRSGTDLGDEPQMIAGDALILSSHGSATLTNSGDLPATTLTLLSGEDAEATSVSGTTQAILVRLLTLPPPPPLALTLARTALKPGEQFLLPPAPTVTVLATVERAQAFSLSGDEINRGKEPIDIYVLTLAQASTAPVESATPAMDGGAPPRGWHR